MQQSEYSICTAIGGRYCDKSEILRLGFGYIRIWHHPQVPRVYCGLIRLALPRANLRFCRAPHVDDKLERQRPKHKVTFSVDPARAKAGLRSNNKVSIREFVHQILRLDEELGMPKSSAST